MARTVALLFVLIFVTASVIEVNPVSRASSIENTWTTKASIPREINGDAAAVVNGKIYLMSHSSYYGSYNYEYDPETDNWVEKTLMPTPRYTLAIVAFQNKIYTMGGSLGWTEENGTIYSCANEVYDPTTDTWETKAPIPVNQSGNVLASVVYGQIHLMDVDSHYVYDVATDSWIIKDPPPFQFEYLVGPVVFDSKIYVFDRDLTTHIYDPKSDTWSLGTPPLVYNAFASACATTGAMALKRIYLFGGTAGMFGAYNFTQVYDPESDTWTLGESMPTSRGSPDVAVVNDQIYVIGGSLNMYYRSNANELYTPFGYGTPDPLYVPPDGPVPEVSVLSPENRTYYTADIQLNLKVNEPDLWMRYNLDNENITEISSNTTITGLSLGLHNLTVYVTDAAGNTAACQPIHFEVQEPFPTTLVIAPTVISAVVGIGLLVYFKKRKH